MFLVRFTQNRVPVAVRRPSEIVSQPLPSLRDSCRFPTLPRACALGYDCPALRAGFCGRFGHSRPTAIFAIGVSQQPLTLWAMIASPLRAPICIFL